MAYSDFTLESAETKLGIMSSFGEVFEKIPPIAPQQWLLDALECAKGIVLNNEKSRSEFIVAPVLLAVRELTESKVSLYSGLRFDVDPTRGLVGECDFVLSLAPQAPVIRPPMMAIVEAKKRDFELGLGQCLAQLVAAQMFNQRAGGNLPVLYGCVTTGDEWLFLKITGTQVTMLREPLRLHELNIVLGYFVMAYRKSTAAATYTTASTPIP